MMKDVGGKMSTAEMVVGLDVLDHEEREGFDPVEQNLKASALARKISAFLQRSGELPATNFIDRMAEVTGASADTVRDALNHVELDIVQGGNIRLHESL